MNNLSSASRAIVKNLFLKELKYLEEELSWCKGHVAKYWALSDKQNPEQTKYNFVWYNRHLDHMRDVKRKLARIRRLLKEIK